MRSRFVVIVATWAVVAGLLAAPAGADHEITVVDDTVTVTVVYADSISLVEGTPPDTRPDWPYSCEWSAPWMNTDVIYTPVDRPVEGWRYWLSCTPAEGSGLDPIGQFVVYDPADPVPIPGVITSLEIMQFIRDTGAQIPTPLLVGTNPATLQITGVETWLWPDGSVQSFEVSATAGGLVVTARVVWQRTIFDVGEPGVDPIVCHAVVEWTAGSAESDCAHTYLTEAQGRSISATSEWDVYWWDNGAQPSPAFYETISLTETDVVDVLDLEAVISARR